MKYPAERPEVCRGTGQVQQHRKWPFNTRKGVAYGRENSDDCTPVHRFIKNEYFCSKWEKFVRQRQRQAIEFRQGIK